MVTTGYDGAATVVHLFSVFQIGGVSTRNIGCHERVKNKSTLNSDRIGLLFSDG
jgi:hypothetical protein